MKVLELSGSPEISSVGEDGVRQVFVSLPVIFPEWREPSERTGEGDLNGSGKPDVLEEEAQLVQLSTSPPLYLCILPTQASKESIERLGQEAADFLKKEHFPHVFSKISLDRGGMVFLGFRV
ncbi:MAG: hypothetical protein A2722_02160 [Candidatus Doudnabacteria bacterium RIFCSPHIGHO2_01_FULL_50_11]|uniref:Uncharacterized protein n=1 Tax=Candidatus Doudnabacteria bacterium RIFCSPHIGHO2_01_FULL_50_11 TaxID=1817828 RepID=A0A1F5PI62_9BACT|nr:MAG: hypothetical protein A2722_02160 [Candidatus Doudnabacteria bacterium RIFCSPHIGHO2_01_FULL_50_11]HLC45209.1 hypothetical protein [Patescibacteria group bacterium]